MFGLVLYYSFQYPTRKFPGSTEFWEFWELKHKIFNSRIPVSFLGLRQNIVASLEWVGIGWERKWLVLSAWDGKFPRFFEKIPVPGKWHSGKQISSLGTNEFPHQSPFLYKKIMQRNIFRHIHKQNPSYFNNK